MMTHKKQTNFFFLQLSTITIVCWCQRPRWTTTPSCSDCNFHVGLLHTCLLENMSTSRPRFKVSVQGHCKCCFHCINHCLLNPQMHPIQKHNSKKKNVLTENDARENLHVPCKSFLMWNAKAKLLSFNVMYCLEMIYVHYLWLRNQVTRPWS